MRSLYKKGFKVSLNQMINKKGLSPTISTVLLLALILVLAAIIFLWMRGFVKESILKNGLKAEQLCEQLRFDAYFKVESNLDQIIVGDLMIVNEGNVPINGFEIRQEYNGEVKRTPFLFFSWAGGNLAFKKDYSLWFC